MSNGMPCARAIRRRLTAWTAGVMPFSSISSGDAESPAMTVRQITRSPYSQLIRRRNGSAEYAQGQLGSVNSQMTTSASSMSAQRFGMVMPTPYGRPQLRVRRL